MKRLSIHRQPTPQDQAPSRRRPPRLASVILPAEVWEVILDQLSDEGLLAASRLCLVLNELAIRMYFHRNNVDLSTPPLRIRSNLARSLFLLACEPVGLKSLHVIFWRYGRGHTLLYLHEIAQKFPSLREIRLDLDVNVLGRQFEEMLAGCKQAIRPEVILDAWWKLIRVVSMRGGGPLVLVAGGALHRCDVSVLSRSKIVFENKKTGNYTYRETSIVKRAYKALKGKRGMELYRTQEVELCAYLDVAVKAGNVRVEKVDKVHLRPIVGFQDRDGATLLEFESKSLRLAPNESFSAAQLSAILPQLRVPGLKTLVLGTLEISPGALSQFLANHYRISRIILACPWDSDAAARGPLRLCEPAAAVGFLPSIDLVCHTDIRGIGALLDMYGASHDPTRIATTLHRETAAQRAALVETLEHIATTTQGNETHLLLNIPPGFAATPKVEDSEHDSEAAALGRLRGTREVLIMTDSLEDARAALAWVAHLPSSSEAVFKFDWLWPAAGPDARAGGPTAEEMKEFKQEVWNVLPNAEYAQGMHSIPTRVEVGGGVDESEVDLWSASPSARNRGSQTM
ncbi:hypothetical protein HMN09_00191800 [Mycena chlorophos]|uniref:F-box domain-containing protein n=1 Tax=Mycena chlorophos TaxID=658473 RepID=A0A8H6TNW2_MYCCL|nr:hypothetical protein HMN09_00191800 [Mycena chlorophos]